MQNYFGGERSLTFNADKMLMAGDLNLNSMQGYPNSLKEILKKTMLSQEIVFQNQVHELHRVYRKQQTLMENFGWKEIDGYNFWKESPGSTLEPITNAVKYLPLAKERTSSRSPVVDSARCINKVFLKESPSDYSRLQQQSFDMQLSAVQYDNHVYGDPLGKGHGWGFKGTVESKHQFDSTAYREEVNLTLGIGGDARRKSSNKGTLYDKITHSSEHLVIDLDDSTNTASDAEAKSVSYLSSAALINGDEHDSQVPVLSDRLSTESVKKDLSHGIKMRYSLVGSSQSCEDKNSLDKESDELHGDIKCTIFSKRRPTCKVFGLDLNQIQIDDSSYLNDPPMACQSTVGLSGAFVKSMGNYSDGTCPADTSWRKAKVNSSSEHSNLLQQDGAANSTSKDPHPSNAAFKEQTHNAACLTDPESEYGPLTDIYEDNGSNHRNPGDGKIDFLVKKFPGNNYAEVTAGQVVEKLEEVVFSSPCGNGTRVEDRDSNKSHTTCEYDCIADDSSSGAKTMQSGTDLGGSHVSSSNHFLKSHSFGDAETQSGEHDLRSSDSNDPKYQCCNKKGEEPTAGDIEIQRAAESLVHFYLGSSAINQDQCTKEGSDEIENEGMDRPQNSLDSYESIVLKITESSMDDFCVTSKPSELDKLDKKDCTIKLRRGRRLKDFQKDILPGLASLSRHEIREDVSIMEAVIRSREYKRMRSKMANGGNWFAPIKSRRSRLNYVGRRFYS